MPRAVAEWIGETDDTRPPPRVEARVFLRCDGRCDICGTKLTRRRDWILEHRKALINEGQNRESNLGVTCVGCAKIKTRADVAEKAIIARKRAKHIGVRRSARPMPGSKASKWRRKIDGTTERRTP
jgi:hypothetical protein